MAERRGKKTNQCHRAVHDGFLSVKKVPQPDVEYRVIFIRLKGWEP